MNGWEPDMNIDKEELIFKKRLLDLAKMAASRDICTYADFLNQHEISLYIFENFNCSFYNRQSIKD